MKWWDSLGKRTYFALLGSAQMMIDCDENMIIHLLRNWHPNRLRPQGFRLANERPRLITMQNGVCPLCPEPRPRSLANDGKVTHIDHKVTVKEFADKVLRGELTFDDAYRQLWEDSNLRAVHRGCNYDRNVGRRLA
jgi:hypothetical protein